jgi:hypothetical protein
MLRSPTTPNRTEVQPSLPDAATDNPTTPSRADRVGSLPHALAEAKNSAQVSQSCSLV